MFQGRGSYVPLSHQHSVASKMPPTGVHSSTLVKGLPFHLAAWVNTHVSTQVSGPPTHLYTFVNAHPAPELPKPKTHKQCLILPLSPTPKSHQFYCPCLALCTTPFSVPAEDACHLGPHHGPPTHSQLLSPPDPPLQSESGTEAVISANTHPIMAFLCFKLLG